MIDNEVASTSERRWSDPLLTPRAVRAGHVGDEMLKRKERAADRADTPRRLRPADRVI